MVEKFNVLNQFRYRIFNGDMHGKRDMIGCAHMLREES